MAMAWMEAARRLGSPSDAKFARLLNDSGAPGVTENQVYYWRRGETTLPAYALWFAAVAVGASIDELVATATGVPGALALRMDALETELRVVRAELRLYEAAVIKILGPIPPVPDDSDSA